jgi:hypothetical protein
VEEGLQIKFSKVGQLRSSPLDFGSGARSRRSNPDHAWRLRTF